MSLSPCWLQASVILLLGWSGLSPFNWDHGRCCDARCKGEGWSIFLSSSQVFPHPSGHWRNGLPPGGTHVWGQSLCLDGEHQAYFLMTLPLACQKHLGTFFRGFLWAELMQVQGLSRTAVQESLTLICSLLASATHSNVLYCPGLDTGRASAPDW